MKRIIQTGAALAALVHASNAAGQMQEDPTRLVPPIQTSDRNGVDLMSGLVRTSVPLVSFGEHAGRLSASLEIVQPGVPIYGSSDFMLMAGWLIARSVTPRAGERIASFTNVVFPFDAGYYQYPNLYDITNPDGSRYKRSLGATHVTRLVSNNPDVAGVYNANGDRGVGSTRAVDPAAEDWFNFFDKIVFVNGEEWRFHREFVMPPTGSLLARTRSIVSSRGYAIQFLYMSDGPPVVSGQIQGAWYALRRVTAYNKAFVHCNEALLQECPAVTALPSSTDFSYDSTAGTITVRANGATDGTEIKLFTDWDSPWGYAGDVASIRHTGVPGSTRSFRYYLERFQTEAEYRAVTQVIDADGTTTYGFTRQAFDGDFVGWYTSNWGVSTDALNGQTQVLGYLIFGQPYSITDELNRITQFDIDYNVFRPIRYNLPGGTGVETVRDVRNNITRIIRHPRPNAGEQPFVAHQATYPSDCMNPRTCNRPTAVTDANNNTTEFSYAPEHGGITLETGPAAPTRQNDGSMANVRPQKRYEYAQRSAWTSNGSGGYQASPPIWVLMRERSCRSTNASGSGCAGGPADEVVIDYDYGPNSGPNNLLLRGVTTTAYVGDVPHSHRVCYMYDEMGNRVTETQPNAGAICQ